MDYEQAFDYLHSLIDFEKLGATYFGRDRFQLANVRRLLSGLGQPQEAFPVVHLAGTKGKGSTAAMLDAILRQAGYSVGLFTKPHLVDIRERTRLDGRMIGKPDFAAAVAAVKPLVDQINADRATEDITFYEAHLAASLLYFAREHVDIAVIETGLGGRLDATNALEPVVCGITCIDYDHTDLLGDRLEDIAREKAGIMKPGVPCILAPQAPQVMAVLQSEASAVDAPTIPCPAVEAENGTFAVRGRRLYCHLTLTLLGQHQRENAAVAIGLTESLESAGFHVTPEAIGSGLASVEWPGRFQVIPGSPTTVLDVAHNAVSARVLREALGELLRKRSGSVRLLLVVGMPEDKDIAAFAQALFPLADRVCCTQADSPRAAAPERLRAAARGLAPVVTCVAPVAEALEAVRQQARPQDVICVTGSFHVVGEAMVALGIRP